MPLSLTLVWEVRTTGSDANGGAFRAGAPGTDYSQQNAPQIAYTDLLIGGTNTQLTSVANPFTSAHVGNVINITGGTGFTAGRYEISSVASNVATMDRSVGTASSTGGTGNLGGCLATLGVLGTSMVAQNKAFVKSGTYNITATAIFSAAFVNPSHGVPTTTIEGYFTTRGDIYPKVNEANRPQVVVNAVLGASAINFSSGTGAILNIVVAAGTGSFTNGIQNASRTQNCKASGFSTRGIFLTAPAEALFCEVTGGLTGSAMGIGHANSNTVVVMECNIHDNACPGVIVNTFSSVLNCLITNNTGAASDGILATNQCVVYGNTVHGNGRDGIRLTTGGETTFGCRNNILSQNGAYGINCSAGAGTAASWRNDGNAFYSNTSGATNNLSDTGSTNPVNGIAPYAYQQNVTTMTSTPFVNAAAGDFRLNTSAGGGSKCRGTGVPSSWPGSSVIGLPNFGAVQDQPSGGGVSISFMGF